MRLPVVPCLLPPTRGGKDQGVCPVDTREVGAGGGVAVLLIKQSEALLPGTVVLQRDGTVVWCGPLGAPWEDVEADTIYLATDDYNDVSLRTLPDGRKIP